MQGSLPRPQRIIFAHLPHPSLPGQVKVKSPLLFLMFPFVLIPKLCVVLGETSYSSLILSLRDKAPLS